MVSVTTGEAGIIPTPGAREEIDLPTWPLTWVLAGFPLWWLLGIVEFIWIPAALVMALAMVRTRSLRAPRGFGIWLIFLLWAGLSVVQLNDFASLPVFSYRYLVYLACAVLLLYIYNNRRSLTDRFISGVLTIWWLITVAGGYAALALPTASVRTPMSYLVPGALLENPWINHMVIRKLNQYNPDSFFDLAPRPSAPFLYTNNWGSVYSLLLPFVVVYLFHSKGRRRFWFLLAALVASAVPAVATLNRGMFIGIGIAALYGALRLALMGRTKAVVVIVAALGLGVGIFQGLSTDEALEARLEGGSTEDRATLYVLALDAAWESPVLGYGRTLDQSETDTRDPVGTQGQFWVLLISHGIPATFFFVTWFLVAFVRSIRRTDPGGLAANTVLLVSIVELTFYGMIAHGLPIMMIAAGVGLRSHGYEVRHP